MNKQKLVIVSVLVVAGCISLWMLAVNVSSPRIPAGSRLLMQWSKEIDGTILELSATEDGSLIFARTANKLYALSSHTSTIVWEHNISRQVETSPALAVDGRVFIADSVNLWALDERTGKTIWSQPLQDTRGWVTDASEDVVLVNERSNDMQAYNAKTGKLLWAVNTGLGYTFAFLDGATAYIADFGVRAVDSQSGRMLWNEADSANGWSDYKDGIVYYSSGANVAAYDARNRRQLWRLGLNGQGIRRVDAADGWVLITDADHLYVVDQARGKLEWSAQIPYPANPRVFQGNIYVMESFNRRVQIFSAKSGEKLGSVRVALPRLFWVYHRDIVQAGDLLIFSSGKTLYAYSDEVGT
jgi:outer membrane protein assembly factor BamB